MYNKKLINIVGECIEDDKTVILENLNEMIEAKLSPIKGRNVYKKNSINSVTTKPEIHKFFRFIMRRNYIILQKFKPNHV